MTTNVARATLRAMETMPPPHDRCPACGAHLPATAPPACPRCALPLVGPVAEELRETDRALLRLDAERGRLIARRGELLARLRPPYPPAPWGPRPGAPWGASPRRETSPRAVQNLLLALGGVLLAVAAIAFTVISWGHLGIGGRATVLGALTLAATGVPALLLRRSLTATAEVVACLGLVLLLLDAYALRQVALGGTDGLRYAAVSLAVVAAVWAGYGKALGRLVLPVPLAVVIAQLPLALWASAAESAYGLASALLVTAALDAVLALLTAGRGTRITAAIAGTPAGAAGLLTAGGLSVSAGDGGAALRAGALLLGAAVAAVAVALRPAVPAAVAGILSGVAAPAVVCAAGGVIRVGVPGDWIVPGYLVCATAVLAAAVLVVPARPAAAGLAAGAGAVHGLALLWALPSLTVGVLTPGRWEGPYSAVAVAGLLASVLGAAAWRYRGSPYGPVAASGAVVLGAVAVCVPGLPPMPLPVRLVVVAGLLALSARALTWTALVTACGLAATAVAWAYPERATTLTVLAVLAACFGALFAVASRTRAVSAAAVVTCAAGLAWTGLPAHAAAFTLLATAAAAQAAALRDTGRPFEHPGHAAALVGVCLVADDPELLALALATAGVLAAGVAVVRADRRWMAYIATCLTIAASWVRLAASDVDTPEAYTLPVTAAALTIGALRRRRDPSSSSWVAYAPGLCATLLPSLVAAWNDPGWIRPLALGAAALAVLLLGARHRLAAPLVLGAGVLALDALHELAPYIAQALGAVPRWVPLALAGVLLLGVGATYERRLRDVRRVREALGRLR